jgi:putative hydrolase of the HAD superfamily
MRRQPAKALLIDFDGVLRRWDPSVAAGVEASYGLAPGTLMETAFEWHLLRAAVTGELTHAQWMGVVAERLADPAKIPTAMTHRAGQPPAQATIALGTATAAVAQWQAHRGFVDTQVLTLIRDVRAAGLPVGLATNATDRLDADLEALGLVGEVDAVINSSAIGVHKPAPAFFDRACEAIGTAAQWTLFVDDDDRVVRAARAAKLLAYRWTGSGLPYLRAALDQGRPAPS